MRRLTPGNEVNELSLETDEDHRSRVRYLTAVWPQPLREHSERLLNQQIRRKSALPKFVTFIPVYHGTDDPQADARLETDINELFDTQLTVGSAIASGENHTIPYVPIAEIVARTRHHEELDRTIKKVSAHARLVQRGAHVSGFERSMQRVLDLRPEIPVAGFESTSGAILASILEQEPRLAGLSPQNAMNAKWAVAIEARTRQALNRAADHFGAVDLFFVAGGLHGPGVDRWCKRNGVEFKMAVSDVMTEKLPDFYR
jgi:hypothetical protein